MPMSRWKTMFMSGAIAIAITLALPINALAAPYSDNVAGVEVYATATEGIFVGAATGSLPGPWSLTVLHTPLVGTATITGGTFHIATVQNGRGELVTGVLLPGGSVSQTGGTAPCANETFTVIGGLGHVGVSGQSRSGTGSFSATLTHYQHKLLGSCLTYAASIVGAVSLVF
jgi:hypothetical protein